MLLQSVAPEHFDEVKAALDWPVEADPDTWGTTPEAQAGQQAMMAMLT